MKKYFFLRRKIPCAKFRIFPTKRILILVFSVLLPFSLHGRDNDSIVASDQEQAIIYLTDNAEVYGLPNISNALVIKSNSSHSVLKEEKKKEHRDSNLVMKVAESEKLEKKVLKELQDKINTKISHFYYNDSDSKSLLNAKLLQLNNIATNVLVTSQILKGIAASNDFVIITIRQYLVKQQFYTSLCYLQFGKLLNSFLRGPPIV